MSSDRTQFSLRGGKGRAWFETADNCDQRKEITFSFFDRIETYRKPDIELTRKTKTGGHHANDRVGLVVECESALQNRFVASVAALPETFANDRNVVRAGFVLFGQEEATDLGGVPVALV